MIDELPDVSKGGYRKVGEVKSRAKELINERENPPSPSFSQSYQPPVEEYAPSQYPPQYPPSHPHPHRYTPNAYEPFINSFKELGGYIDNTPPSSPSSSLNCLDVNNHISNCPVCRKIYGSDSIFYIVIIIVLALVCLILLRKIMWK